MQWLKKLRIDVKLRRQLAAIACRPYYWEYLALGEEICESLSFQGYYTLRYGSWPKDFIKSTW
jgi:hypothetical protein